MIMGPIFEFGKNKRRVDIQRAEAEIAVNRITWILTVERLVMLKMHLMVSDRTEKNIPHESGKLRQPRKALMLTRAKYDAGYTSYLEVLIAESYAFDAEMLASYTTRTATDINSSTLQGAWRWLVELSE